MCRHRLSPPRQDRWARLVALVGRPHPPGGGGGQLGRGAGEVHPPLQQHDDLGADRGDVVGLVGGQHDHRVARQVGQQLPEPQPLLRVQPGRRLVQDQQVRLAEQGLGDAQALPHPAGQGPYPRAGAAFQPDGGQHPGHLLGAAAPVGDLLQDRHVVQEPGDREVPVIAQLLRQVAEPPADLHPLRRIPRVQAEHRHPPRVRLVDGGQDRQQRRLARAVRAEQAGDPPVQGEIDLVQGPGGAVPPGQAVGADSCGAHVHGHLVHPNSKRSRRASSTTAAGAQHGGARELGVPLHDQQRNVIRRQQQHRQRPQGRRAVTAAARGGRTVAAASANAHSASDGSSSATGSQPGPGRRNAAADHRDQRGGQRGDRADQQQGEAGERRRDRQLVGGVEHRQERRRHPRQHQQGRHQQERRQSSGP